MPVDLHTHSTCSDGSDPPEVLVERAARAGLRAVALTDHDTQEGVVAAMEAGGAAGIEVIPGTEISCAWEPGGLHLVVLFLEPGPGPLQDRLSELQERRNRRNDRIVENLRALGIDIALDEVHAEAGPGSVGRPHFAAVLVRKGVVPDIPTAFSELLAKGRPGYADRPRLSPEEAIDLALRSRAVPVLAHPHTLGLDDEDAYRRAFAGLAAAGLVGMECHYGDYDAEARRRMETVARSHGLIPSGGSDYHGSYKEGLELGRGYGDLIVSDSTLDELRAALPPAGP